MFSQIFPERFIYHLSTTLKNIMFPKFFHKGSSITSAFPDMFITHSLYSHKHTHISNLKVQRLEVVRGLFPFSTCRYDGTPCMCGLRKVGHPNARWPDDLNSTRPPLAKKAKMRGEIYRNSRPVFSTGSLQTGLVKWDGPKQG